MYSASLAWDKEDTDFYHTKGCYIFEKEAWWQHQGEYCTLYFYSVINHTVYE